MNTTENNKLIAEFLGYEPNTNGVYPIVCINEGKGWHLETMKYHFDWNWLMEVVRKIRVLVMEDVTDDLYNSEYWDNITHKLVELEIESVYNACVEFIKWYNENSR